MSEFPASLSTPRGRDSVRSSAHLLPWLVAAGLLALLMMLGALAPEARAEGGAVTTSATTLSAASNPDFDAVPFRPLGCNAAGDPEGDASPSTTDLVGDAAHPATYFAWDASYLYFRFRVSKEPSGSKGFDQNAWVVLLQVPSGNPFQHQFELSLDGLSADDDFGNTGGQKGDTIEIWRNDPAENVAFTPLFNDPSELRLFAQRYDYAGPETVNTAPLARVALATDGSAFGGDADYFVEFAFPMSVLIAKGVLTSAAQMADSLAFPATSANPNQYNKDYLACPFLPYTSLSVTKGVAPATIPASIATGIAHTITVRNSGDGIAKGVVIEDTAFPSSFSGVAVSVTSDEPTVTWTVASTNPLLVRVPALPIGRSVTVRIQSSATLACGAPTFTNTATAYATNADDASATATLGVNSGFVDICDGKDNNCDGQVDEATTSCDDGNPCNGSESCVHGSCAAGVALNCSQGNPCVDDSCDPAVGCVHANNTKSCSDGNACTTNDTCGGGVCIGGPPATPDCREPKPVEYYRSLCGGPGPLDALTPADVACVNDWSTFAPVTSIDDVCRILNPDPADDACLQAEAQLMAALLNLCKGRLALDEPIVSACGVHTTVGQSLIDANTLLSKPGRTSADCAAAACETEELNSGKAVGTTTLLADRTPAGVHVTWRQPPTGPGWFAPVSYSVWRRPRGVGAFAVIATVPGLVFDDPGLDPATDYEYGVTVNW